tara:strand:- start:24311 stop:24535 length:225 start_codon:yes stop_codon:yes gene_type:complete
MKLITNKKLEEIKEQSLMDGIKMGYEQSRLDTIKELEEQNLRIIPMERADVAAMNMGVPEEALPDNAIQGPWSN